LILLKEHITKGTFHLLRNIWIYMGRIFHSLTKNNREKKNILIITRIWTVKENILEDQKAKRRRRTNTWSMNSWIGWPKGLFLFREIFITCLSTWKSCSQSTIWIRNRRLRTISMILLKSTDVRGTLSWYYM